MASIALLIRIRATPEDVYSRVATTAGIAQWFTEASSPDYREGGSLELRFSGEPVLFRISEAVEPARIVWRCTSKGNSWFDTDIVFSIAPENEGTLVRFDHLGWPEVSDRFRDCSMSWAYFLESLRSLIEEGRGTPEGVAPPCESATAV